VSNVDNENRRKKRTEKDQCVEWWKDREVRVEFEFFKQVTRVNGERERERMRERERERKR